jgi:hypothetical protein
MSVDSSVQSHQVNAAPSREETDVLIIGGGMLGSVTA